MSLKTLVAAAALVLAATATSAAAAPAGGLLKTLDAGAEAQLIQVHGIHHACERGPAGWHRSPRPGVRITCRPARPSGLWWIWRCADGRCGYWHRKHRHWH